MHQAKAARFAMVGCTIVSLMFLTLSCGKESSIEGIENGTSPGVHQMSLIRPSNFPELIYDTSENRLTKQGFELGRKLFYDVRLSRDNTISCGSCHNQSSSFTQAGHSVSHGVDDRLGVRNSQPIFNLGWSKFFMWDGGVFNLDLQPLAPLKNPVEMDAQLSDVIAKLQADAKYPALFETAFGSREITSNTMLKALSQFMVQCVSANSEYDKAVRGEGPPLSAGEEAGRTLFTQKCASCHSTDLFTDNAFHNNGLPPTTVNDKGRSAITLQANDDYLFKTPTLRNLQYTAPYMHDGRFFNLQQVLDHYSTGVQASATLDPLLKKNNQVGILLTDDEKKAIMAFLKTLNDESFIHDTRFSEQ